MTKGLGELAISWIKLQHAEPESDEERELMPASIAVDLLCINQPIVCLKIIEEILSLSSDKWIIENLAAGPVESLLANHPSVGLEWIRNESSKNIQIYDLLDGIWKNRIADAYWEEIQIIKSKLVRQLNSENI